MKVLLTGAAGFIGFNLTKRPLEEGNNVIVIDNINNYYDLILKKSGLVNQYGIKILGNLSKPIYY